MAVISLWISRTVSFGCQLKTIIYPPGSWWRDIAVCNQVALLGYARVGVRVTNQSWMYFNATFFFSSSAVWEKRQHNQLEHGGLYAQGVTWREFLSRVAVFTLAKKCKLVIKLANSLQTRRYCKTVGLARPELANALYIQYTRKYKSVHRRRGKIRYIPPFPFVVHSSHPPTRMPLTPCKPGLRGTPAACCQADRFVTGSS